MPIINGLDRHQLTFSSLEARFATKKAVIVKLLLIYLKTTLRKLHNTLLASYGLTHLLYFFWHSLNFHFVQRALLHGLLFVLVFSDFQFISCPPGKTTRPKGQSEAKA